VTDWATFAGLTAVALFALLALARASSGAVPASDDNDASGDAARPDPEGPAAEPLSEPPGDRPPDAVDADAGVDDRAPGGSLGADPFPAEDVDPITGVDLSGGPSTGALLLNVAVSQGIFGALVLGAAWYTEVPASAFGAAVELSGALPAAALGAVIGLVLYAANAGVAVVAGAAGIEFDSGLRELLTPETPAGWALLLGVVLPTIAGVEELLFRGALVGALSVGFDVSPWLLAVASSGAFALGHGAQGRAGIAVTGLLGFALAAAFVLTGSLLTVVVAHYVVNATEFVAGGWLGVEWGQVRNE